MATKTKTAARRGGKTTGKRNAGRTAKASTYAVPRSARQLAAAIQQRLKRSPDYWEQVRAAMTPPRIAQVEPRQGAATH